MDTLGFLAWAGVGKRKDMLRWENEEAFFWCAYSFLRELPWIACSCLMRAAPYRLFLIDPSMAVVSMACDGFRGILKALNYMPFAPVVLRFAYI
jgi:hypothetical protein